VEEQRKPQVTMFRFLSHEEFAVLSREEKFIYLQNASEATKRDAPPGRGRRTSWQQGIKPSIVRLAPHPLISIGRSG
jgi:hypothetical protein